MLYGLFHSNNIPTFKGTSGYPAGHKRNRSESDDELSLPNRAKRSATGHQIEIGVGLDDLPIAGLYPNEAIQYYEQLPVQRKLDWRSDEHGRLIRRELSNKCSLLAAFAQTRGDMAPVPCTHCVRGLGPWNSCIVGSDTTRDRPSHGACANCRFSRRAGCNIRANCDHDNDNDGIRISALFDPDFLASSPLTDIAVKTRRSSSLGEKSLPRRESTNNTIPRTQAPSEEVTILEPKPIGAEAEASYLRPRHGCIFDGKVLPFPLGPETFDNLPLLEQVMVDITTHLDVIKKRVAQLKEKERNPWDFVASNK